MAFRREKPCPDGRLPLHNAFRCPHEKRGCFPLDRGERFLVRDQEIAPVASPHEHSLRMAGLRLATRPSASRRFRPPDYAAMTKLDEPSTVQRSAQSPAGANVRCWKRLRVC